MLHNKYYLHSNENIICDLFDPDFVDSTFLYQRTTYLRRVLEIVDQKMSLKGLTFYINLSTEDGIRKLPSYGSNVVAIVRGDEKCRIPLYVGKVKAIFKCQGKSPQHLLDSRLGWLQPSYLSFLEQLQYMQTLAFYLPGWINYWFYYWKNKGIIAPIYDIPLGYDNQLDLPLKKFSERTNDVFFGGSIIHQTKSPKDWQYWLKTPKSVSREGMVLSLAKIREKLPGVKMAVTTNNDYQTSINKDPNDGYSERMMDSKVCLVPRGASLDTCRLFEALRYGCIVIADRVPTTWFYTGSPVIQISDWGKLESALVALLEDSHLLQQKHEEHLAWWEDKCSEVAVGKYIADVLST